MSATQPTHAPREAASGPASLHTVARVFAAVLVFMVTFVWLFLAAFHDPRPNGLEVAVVGPPQLEQQLQSRVDQAGVGEIDFVGYANPGEAREAVADQDVQGALIAASDRPQLLVASAGSFMIAQAVEQLITRASAAAGTQVTVEDVRPLPESDSRGLSPVFLTFGIVLPSFALGLALWAVGGRLSARVLAGGLVGFALVAGLAAAFTADVLVGSLSGAFWQVTLLSALLVLAVAGAVAGLARLTGPVAIPVALLLFVLLAQVSSGGPVGHLMLPDFFQAISQFLPSGAGITAIRDTVYFSGEQTLLPVVVLGGWAVAGLLMLAAGRDRGLLGDASAGITVRS